MKFTREELFEAYSRAQDPLRVLSGRAGFTIVWKFLPGWSDPLILENTTLGVKITIDGVQYGDWKYYQYEGQSAQEVFAEAKKMLDRMKLDVSRLP